MTTKGASSTGMAIAPVDERGRDISTNYDFVGMLPWGQWIDDVERAPDLKWPQSVTVYDQVRNDSQCQGLYLGATSAILRYIWYIDPNNCPISWVKLLAADLNLPIGVEAALEAAEEGQKRGRLLSHRQPGWYTHLQTALHAMQYGHYYFEKVGEITNDGPGGRECWRLRKLGPRHPRTITEFIVDGDSQLISIKQGDDYVSVGGQYMPSKYEISADHLVPYLWDGEPGNWVGRSMFRPMYRNWLIKDRLLRVDAIKHERNGVGMPIVTGPEGATKAQLQDLDRMAQEYKVGERGGGAIPFGSKLTLQGTQGALPDTIGSIRFQNEEMARSMLMMFMQLGQTESGSRALGQTFVNWFSLQQEVIAEWATDVANEHILGYWWLINVDPEAERAPRLGYYKPPEGDMSFADFVGATLPEEATETEEPNIDDELDEGRTPTQASRRGSGPRRATNGRPHPPPVGATRRRNDRPSRYPAPSSVVAADGPSAAVVAPEPFHRRPYQHEVTAAADFTRIDDLARIYVDNILHMWVTQIQPQQLAQINSSLAGVAPGAHEEMVGLTVEVLGSDEMYELLHHAAEEAVNMAVGEVAAQGRASRAVSWTSLNADLKSRSSALSAIVAQALADTAGRYALRRANAEATSADIADGVITDLRQLSDAWLRDQFHGIVQSAINQGRLEVFTSTDEDATLWASEIMDVNTCSNCAAIDGQRLSAQEATRLYASGGYINCLGNERCRGTIVATYGEDFNV